MSNNRIAHPFLRKLTDQKVAYLFAKPFTAQTDDTELATRFSEMFTKDFLRIFQAVARDAIVCGCGWLSVYYDEAGELHTKRLTPENTAAIYDPENLDQMQAVLRRFEREGGQYYELWTAEGVKTYAIMRDELIEAGTRPHFTIQGEGFNWQKIPIIPFRYNADGIPLLCFVKSIIDNYDLSVSDIANTLQDAPNALRLVKGYGGDPEEFVRNVAALNTVFMQGEGTIEALQIQIDSTAYETHLARLRKDLYESGSGVDDQESSAGNLSGTAIRFRYSGLDLDCQQMGNEFAAGLEALTWFICEDMRAKGMGEHNAQNVDFIWNTDHIINELETVQILSASRGVISDETIIANHPYVTDAKAEIERIRVENGDAGY